jgi:dephospho-CoA kinase
MKRVLITGMSGTGKSSLIRRFAALGYKAIDTDYGGWRVPPDGSEPPGGAVQPDWIWHSQRMHDLLATEDPRGLFVAGCVENQGDFYERFDHVVLLTAEPALIVERLTTRATNPYGKDPDELARVLDEQRTIEPRLRRSATMVVDTSAPIEQVVATILDRVRHSEAGPTDLSNSG